jgi:hypothetical protein
VIATDVPLKVVAWNGLEAMEMFGGPRPLPLITKILPNAIAAFGRGRGTLLAAFCTLVIAGAAEIREANPQTNVTEQTIGPRSFSIIGVYTIRKRE